MPDEQPVMRTVLGILLMVDVVDAEAEDGKSRDCLNFHASVRAHLLLLCINAAQFLLSLHEGLSIVGKVT